MNDMKLTIKEEPSEEPIEQSLPFSFDTCKWCPYRTKSLSTLLSHVKKHNSKSNLFSCLTANLEAYECPFCHFDNKLKITVDRHISLVHEEEDISKPEIEFKVYTCDRCNFETFSLLMLGNHVCDFYKNKSPFSTEIGRSVERESAFWRQKPKLKYLKIYIPEKRSKFNTVKWFECEQCDYKARRESWLKKHFRSHHTDVTKCEQCGYKAKAEKYLKKHVHYQHSEVIKWFKCEHCPYKSKVRTNLLKHCQVRHANPEDVKWYECALCSHKSKLKLSLENHMRRKHTNPDEIKWYECDQCSYKSDKTDSLKRHRYYMHTDPEQLMKFECEHCPYKAKQKIQLTNHVILKHTSSKDVKWYKCDQCQYKAKLKVLYDRHKKKWHGNG